MEQFEEEHLEIGDEIELPPPRTGKESGTGRFVKGNTYSRGGGANPYKPETTPLHPTIPGRLATGHLIPGGASKGPRPKRTLDLKKEFLGCVKPKDVQKVYEKLFSLTQTDEYGIWPLIEALKLFTNVCFGKPTGSLQIQQKVTSTTTSLNVDLAQLSDDELRTYMGLQQKLQLDHKDLEIEVETKGESEVSPD